MSQPNRALVIIDLQNEFLASSGHYRIVDSSKEALLTNLTALVPEFRKKGHIIWVQSIYDNKGGSQPDGSDSPSRSPSPTTSNPHDHIAYLAGTHKGKSPCCAAGSTNAEIYPAASALIADSDTILTKTNFSAFKNTSLLSTLQAYSVKYVYFCGLLSNICVLATLIDAVQMDGFKVHAVSDCLAWRRDKSHLRALGKMRDMRVNILESREACSEDPGDTVLSIPELYYVNGSIPSWRVQMALHEKVSSHCQDIDVSLTKIRRALKSTRSVSKL
jgi:nicotinamidase-related amidase